MWSNGEYPDQSNGAVGVPGQWQGSTAVVTAPPQQAAGQPYGPQQTGTVVPLHSGSLLPVQTTSATALDNGAFDVPPTLAERIELCTFLANANLLPRALQEAPANVLLLMHKALALGLPLSVAIEHLHVIDGKVGHSAELLRALLHKHGHVLRWTSLSDKEVQGELVLRHDPKNPRREKFTITDAARMELVNKANWKKDPVSMMVARCTTRLVSRHCPEVSMALGNLSAIDTDDEVGGGEPPPRVDDTPQEQQIAADELLIEATGTTDEKVLKDIGGRARAGKLLEVTVDGGITLQTALLRRLDEITTTGSNTSSKTKAKAGTE